VLPLRSTGPLISLVPVADYSSREVPLARGDVLLLYTDGLGEAPLAVSRCSGVGRNRRHPPA
jgi:serine phosphatase RsbU (regulator of sigma subunit)